MAKEEKHTRTKSQIDRHAHEILRVLKSIESHMASLVYETTPSRGFTAGIEKVVAQPFIDESKDNVLRNMIREEIKKSLGDK